MTDENQAEYQEIDPLKFQDPDFTAKGERRAVVALTHLRTLWFNTGSLCNISCRNCYMESTPTNDKLAYLTLTEMIEFLDEMAREDMDVEEIAFTGGEPFMNPDLPPMIGQALQRGYRVLVLTNAMKPLHHKRAELLALKDRYGDKLSVRVSIDHFTPGKHEQIRGTGTWRPMLEGLEWLAENGFNIAVAGRTCWDETDETSRAGYETLFTAEEIKIDATNQAALVLFPEMYPGRDVPEITIHCWDILGVAPETIMCATSRMVIKRKQAAGPVVVPCTLLPYDAQFELGHDLLNAAKSVKLNHPHCATFCVLGGSSCTIS